MTRKISFFDIKNILIIIALGFITYLHTLSYDILYSDDYYLLKGSKKIVEENKSITSILIESIKRDVYFTNSGNPYYRPVLNLSFIFNQLIGKNIVFTRLTNISLHILAVILFYTLLRILNTSQITSLIASIFLIIHPATTVTSVWIPGRNDSILAIFTFLSIISFILYIKKQEIKWLYLLIISFTASLFTKEIAPVLIITLIIFYFIISEKKDTKILIKTTLSLLISLIIWITISSTIHKNSVIISNYKINQPLNILKDTFFLIGKIFFPYELSLYTSQQNINYYYGILPSLLIIFVIYHSIKNKNYYPLLGITLSLSFLIPFSFFNMYYGMYNTTPWDQRLFIPISGVLLALSKIELNWTNLFSKTFKIIITTILAMFYTSLSISYSFILKNKFTYWDYIIERNPKDIKAHIMYATLCQNSNIGCDETLYKKALELNPNQPYVHHNLGTVYLKRGEFKKAEEEFKKELLINPFAQKIYDETITKEELYDTISKLGYGIFLIKKEK